MPLKVAGTLGRADAFTGTFLLDGLMGLSAQDCLERAGSAAAFTCTRFGGWNGTGVSKKAKNPGIA